MFFGVTSGQRYKHRRVSTLIEKPDAMTGLMHQILFFQSIYYLLPISENRCRH
ncbi:hypothetical protein M23134_04178 [Microscilla marina ATCC 23134]|uniref:Uncharacterized protein n=1 Tax=Microscilla marina ATCC 23134 TaxID=313606 RepID=A1ZE37_MICM2|nr:hypothetical protein M23134_04178 [Microscilla marina ATCC 23134]